MTKDDIQLLFQYDRWANKRTLLAVSSLTAEEFSRDLGGSFCSVRDTLIHLIGGEWVWLTYWKNPPATSQVLAELVARRETLFNTNVLHDFAALRSKWSEVELEQMEFLNHVTTDLLGKRLPFRTTQIQLGHLMQHVANHSTYHRGQVTQMIRQLKAEPASTDFHEFLFQAEQWPDFQKTKSQINS